VTNHYPHIAFSAGAVDRQRRTGSCPEYGAALESAPDDGTPAALDQRGMSFIRDADSFFLATVTPDGWPYVQHRGGPKGFVHVFDPDTVALADLAGNQQYVSAGNLDHNPRVAMFFIDYPLRQRLKVYDRARTIEMDDDPELLDRLLQVDAGTIRSRAERAIVVTIEAYDWNCSRHIKPRYDKQRVEEALRLERSRAEERERQLRDEIEQLRRRGEQAR